MTVKELIEKLEAYDENAIVNMGYPGGPQLMTVWESYLDEGEPRQDKVVVIA